MPPSFVTCYICGREFGTRSISIHVPKCAAKWEAQQEQLPRVRRTRAGSGNTMTSCVQGERRAVPAAPANFDKILRGELRGAELARVNQQAAEDYNTSALETCSHCGRTFKPEALERHQKACSEHKPMVKNKGPSYTAQMKNRVSYPKLRRAKPDLKGEEDSGTEAGVEDSTSRAQSPSVIRKETVTITRKTTPVNAAQAEMENSPISSKSDSRIDSDNADEKQEKNVKKTSSLSRKDTIVIQRNQETEDSTTTLLPGHAESHSTESAVVTSLPPRPAQSIKNPPNSISQKSRTPPVPSQSGVIQKTDASNKPQSLPTRTSVPSKEDVICLVETESIFDSEDHRRAILDLVTSYARNVRKEQILSILNHQIFDNVTNLEEVALILNDFVAAKTNNNI